MEPIRTREELEALYPGKFEFTACRNSYDYIYTVEELSELHGKKLQSKRNHCNRFEAAYPDYRVLPLNSPTGSPRPSRTTICRSATRCSASGTRRTSPR